MSELAAVEEGPAWRSFAIALGSARKVAAVQAEGRRPVLASGRGTVSTFLAEPSTVEARPPRGDPLQPEHLRALFKALFERGDRYKAAGAE